MTPAVLLLIGIIVLYFLFTGKAGKIAAAALGTNAPADEPVGTD